MFDKDMIRDFINYGIIASIFLLIPYNKTLFIIIIVQLIFDFINFYIIEKKEYKDTFELERGKKYDN